eukprot:scaffold62162_cov71-Phaeocystis_antarctica.AAC.1
MADVNIPGLNMADVNKVYLKVTYEVTNAAENHCALWSVPRGPRHAQSPINPYALKPYGPTMLAIDKRAVLDRPGSRTLRETSVAEHLSTLVLLLIIV